VLTASHFSKPCAPLSETHSTDTSRKSTPSGAESAEAH
jgi:hypothetical protein